MNLSFHVVDFIRQFLLYFWDGAISIISFWLVLLLCRWLKRSKSLHDCLILK